MAKKDGFCTECGSLISVDDKKDKATCIFCGNEMDKNEALSLTDDAEKRTKLQETAMKKEKENAAELKKQEEIKPSREKETRKPKARKTREVTTIKPLPKKTKIIIVASFVGFVLILAAIFVPMVTTRNLHRGQMDEKVNEALPFSVKDHDFLYMNNRTLLVVTEDEIDDEISRNAFEAFVSLYAAQYERSEDQVRDNLTIRIYSPEGVYECYYEEGIQCSFETAHPTATPEPTVAIE